jgi:hypothetical protein
VCEKCVSWYQMNPSCSKWCSHKDHAVGLRHDLLCASCNFHTMFIGWLCPKSPRFYEGWWIPFVWARCSQKVEAFLVCMLVPLVTSWSRTCVKCGSVSQANFIFRCCCLAKCFLLLWGDLQSSPWAPLILASLECGCSDYLFKLLLIGDSGVGKSCLLLRFAVWYPSLYLAVKF